ncbi:MAG: 30S ribosomal protein S17 [Myxococcales bacterium]|nr:30S ribosomal protein S17 [Myxococcales bacterium]
MPAEGTNEVASAEPRRRRTLLGRVVSDKMDKTVVVSVERTHKHPTYKKYVKTSKNYKAHDESNGCKVDDFVVIQESRPLSRTKRWVVVEVRTAGGVA